MPRAWKPSFPAQPASPHRHFAEVGYGNAEGMETRLPVFPSTTRTSLRPRSATGMPRAWKPKHGGFSPDFFSEVGYGNAEGMETSYCRGRYTSFSSRGRLRECRGHGNFDTRLMTKLVSGSKSEVGYGNAEGMETNSGCRTPRRCDAGRPRSATGMPRAWKLQVQALKVEFNLRELPRSATGMPRAWKQLMRARLSRSLKSEVGYGNAEGMETAYIYLQSCPSSHRSEVGYGNAEGMETVQRYLVGPR